MRHRCCILVLTVTLTAFTLAQPHTATLQRLNQATSLLGGSAPQKLDTVFSADFLQKVPPMQLRMGLAPLIKKYGACESATVVSQQSPFAVKAEAVSDSGYVYPITLTVSPAPPHLIIGFFIATPFQRSVSLESIVRDVAALPGRASITVYDVLADTVIIEHRGDDRLPIGSTFKLYVLGALQSQIAAGRRSWSDVITLDSAWHSLPSGVLHTWPHGVPMTLHTLATQMISISDNTATDHLIHIVGRSTVEDIQTTLGHGDPSRNVPFRTTMEAFREKYGPDGTMISDQPVLVDSVEWFASTAELCKAMAYFYHQAKGSLSDPVLQIMAVNPGINLSRDAWPYVGYKGGSEPGTINMTYLAQSAKGRWYAASVTWTQLHSTVDVAQVAAIASGLFRYLEQAQP